MKRAADTRVKQSAGLGGRSTRGPLGRAEPPNHPILQLQAQAGNQAVQKLVRSGGVHTKLAVSLPDDPQEREADQVADRIMRSSKDAPASSACACEGNGELCDNCRAKQNTISRKTPAAAFSAPAIHAPIRTGIERALRGSGQPLDPATRAFFEPRFGTDLGGVRVHTDADAARSAASILANAYAVDRHIVFGTGQYSPGTRSGLHLLAHELTHVIQREADSQQPGVASPQFGPLIARQANDTNPVGTLAPIGPPPPVPADAEQFEGHALVPDRFVLWQLFRDIGDAAYVAGFVERFRELATARRQEIDRARTFQQQYEEAAGNVSAGVPWSSEMFDAAEAEQARRMALLDVLQRELTLYSLQMQREQKERQNEAERARLTELQQRPPLVFEAPHVDVLIGPPPPLPAGAEIFEGVGLDPDPYTMQSVVNQLNSSGGFDEVIRFEDSYRASVQASRRQLAGERARQEQAAAPGGLSGGVPWSDADIEQAAAELQKKEETLQALENAVGVFSAQAKLPAEYFAQDVKSLAANYLAENRRTAVAEMRDLGLGPLKDASQSGAKKQDDSLKSLKDIARLVSRAQAADAALGDIQVGWDVDPDVKPGLLGVLTEDHESQVRRLMSSRDYRNRVRPAYFSGFRPYCLPLGDEIPPLARYEDVLEQHERLAAVIASLASAFPSIYALLANDESMADFADADAATSRSTLYDTLNELLKNITNAEAKLASGDLNYLDLTPIHQQLFSGARGPSGTNWQDANNQRVAMDVIHSHESHAFWVSIGLASLAAAAFVVASIATFGTATFFVAAGLGLAAGGYQAYRSWDRYGTFSAASKTALSDDSMLITQAQVNGALAAAVIDTALIFLDAYSIGVKGVRALSAADKLLAAPKAVLPEIAGAETVRVSGNEYIEALGHTFPGRFLEEIPRAVDEIGLEAARRAVRDPRFIAAAARRNWALAGTFFHSTARQVGDQAVLNGVLPAGWRFDFELTIQAGRGGSRLDVFLRGPAGEFLEVDWKTTGRSAMKSLDEMAKHSRQLTSNLGVVLTGQQSQSWVELTRAEWQNLLRDNPQQANALLQGASAAINWP